MTRFPRFLIYAVLCGAPAGAAGPENVLATFNSACMPCHSAAQAAGKLRLATLDGVAAGGTSGPVVVAGNSKESLLYRRISSADPALRMPPAGAALSPDKIEAIRAWIDAGAAGLGTAVNFARDVEPIFRSSCYACHSGPQPKSQFRLDARAAAMQGGTGGRTIVPGNAAGSRLIQRIEGRGGEPRMPFGRTPLTAEQIATLRQWIDAGAQWPDANAGEAGPVEKHWAYRKPVRPAEPAVHAAVNNAIDHFVAARLEQQGLTFSPPADKETLIRRVSLDLTGLPPTPREVDDFVRDTRADAYERVVDRLLASPHYGERWARPWLDYARYADTNGYEADHRRSMWKYRDWVIDALNRDMPFDRFTIEQLAGDLLPNASVAQKIATGFHRNTMFNEEGGVDKDESYFEVLVDRVNTTGTVWLGSTIGCSQCHNHKFDPFLQKEYYQMMVFFSNSEKKAMANGAESSKYEEPVLELPTPAQEQQRAAMKARVKEIETKHRTPTPELEREQSAWEASVRGSTADWSTLRPEQMHTAAGSVLTRAEDDSILASGESAQVEDYTVEGVVKLGRLTGIRLEALPDKTLPRGGPGRDVYGNFSLKDVAAELDDGTGWRPLRFESAQADDGKVQDKRKQQLWIVDASRDEQRLPRQLVLPLEHPAELKAPARLRIRLHHDSDLAGQSIGRLRLSVTAADDPTTIVQVRARSRALLETGAEARSDEQRKQLAEYYRSIAPSFKSERDELKKLKENLEHLPIATALMLGEDKSVERPFDFVRTRGGFSAKAEKVYAGVPAVLGALPPGAVPNRLALAQWLVSRENPLTARVAVNRLWEQYFGHGIVETSEDFGSQGQRPSHPELLDWLACEFMDRGWSMKAIHRLIVTSTAYRQSSKVTPQLRKVDPENRLIARGPRFRVEAEMVRDITLAASGLLSDKVGGPSVFPPQPPGIWDLPYNDDQWEESQGADRYRRGLYTFVRRSAPYPALVNFDATSREYCTIRRIRTNSPLQALTTLNDRAYFEAAGALGRRLAAEGGATAAARIDYGYRLCTSRAAKPAELERLVQWQLSEKNYFRQHPDEARKLAPTAGDPAEDAAWTMVGNVLLNLDETLTKE